LTKQTYDGGPGTSRVYFDYLYDPAGNRTRLTFPDTPSGLSQRYYVQYKYDALNRPIRVCENENAAACTSSTAPLADVSYDALSRRASAAYRNGTSAAYAYTARGDLTGHDWMLPSAALDLNYDFTYNGVGQLLTERVNDPAQRWQPQANGQDRAKARKLRDRPSRK